jgi:hypothetical protein
MLCFYTSDLDLIGWTWHEGWNILALGVRGLIFHVGLIVLLLLGGVVKKRELSRKAMVTSPCGKG